MRKTIVAIAAGASLLTFMTGCAQDGTPVAPTPVAATSAQQPQPSSVTSAAMPAPTTTPVQDSPSAPATSATPSAQPLVMERGTIGSQVRELQARLRQLKYFSGYDVTDTYGPMTANAVQQYQTDNSLAQTGDVDQKTWDALTAATKAPSAQELNNQIPGNPIIGHADKAAVTDLQFRLGQVTGYKDGYAGGWTDATVSAIKEFQTKQAIPVTGEVDQRTYDRLAGATRAPSPWEISGSKAPTASDGQAQVLDDRCKTGRVICASMNQRKVSWVVDGKVLATMDARYGAPQFPTYPGVFHVYYKDANLVSKLYGDVPMPWSLCFDSSRCVHYSEDFTYQGWSVGSHGCVNVRDWNTAKWLFSQVNLGDTVIVY